MPKMNALSSCSTFVTIYQTTRLHTPEDLYSQQHRCDNLNKDQTLCQAVTLLTRGREVLGSDIDSSTAYPEVFFLIERGSAL